MFDSQTSPAAAGAADSVPLACCPGHHHVGVVAGCPCCAPSVGDLLEAVAPDLGAVAVEPVEPAPLGDFIFINARVLTVDAAFSEHDAIAISDGRVVGTGSRDDLADRVDEDAEIIDCQGRTILPGFIEPHMHLLPIATVDRFENVGPFRYSTVAAAMDRLREIAAETPPGTWIMGRQFDPSLQDGPDLLTRDILDEVSTEHPIYVYNASLHFAYCNSLALELAGVDRDTPDDPSSPFGRDADGNPNGVLAGSVAMVTVIRANPDRGSQDIVEACLDVGAKANRVGITTFCDQATGMFQGVRELDFFEKLRMSGRMTARLRYSLSYMREAAFREAGIQPGEGDELVRATGFKIVTDGSNQGRTGLQREPYPGSDDHGLTYIEPADLGPMVRRAFEAGWQVVIHANGDQAIDNTLDAYEAAAAAGHDVAGSRIEHCSLLHDEQIERIAKLGLSPSFLIGHVHYWGKAFRDDIFGAAKADLLDRCASCDDAGIRWTLHSDEPVTEMDALRCIENAVTRSLWKEPGGKLAASEAVSVERAIRAMTIDAAWQCRSDHEVGSLEPGKLADLVVLDADPRDVEPDRIGEINVLETWLGGRRVYAAEA